MFLSQILQMHIQQAIVDLMNEGRSSETIKDSLGILRQYLEVAVANKLITANPANGIVIKEKTVTDFRVLTKSEQLFFMEVIKNRNDWYTELYQYTLASGVRIGEAGALRTEDILRRQLKKRDELKKRLGDRWRAPEELGDLVFVTTLGSPVARHNAEERMRALSEQLNEIQMIRALEEGRIPAEFKPVSPHDLRHTFATRLLEKKMPIEVIAQLLGHADIKVTQRYAHVLDDTLNKEVQRIGNIFDFE